MIKVMIHDASEFIPAFFSMPCQTAFTASVTMAYSPMATAAKNLVLCRRLIAAHTATKTEPAVDSPASDQAPIHGAAAGYPDGGGVIRSITSLPSAVPTQQPVLLRYVMTAPPTSILAGVCNGYAANPAHDAIMLFIIHSCFS